MTKIEKYTTKDKRSYAIHVETDKESFNIPVIDVHDGDAARKSADKVQKQANIQAGSKYFKPSYSWFGYSYNVSRK